MAEEQRHSVAAEAELIKDPDELARREAANGLKQVDKVNEMVEYYLQPERPFRLRTSHLLTLNRIALEGISSYAGNFRPADIEIKGSKHEPPPAYLVPEKIEDLCDYVNEQWRSTSPVHLAAYVLWRLNWIHPFTDGNGRTARAASYFVLCVASGMRLPGTNTIPEQISRDRSAYYKALEAADESLVRNKIDLSKMEEMLEGMLAEQLLTIHKNAKQVRQN
jgi:Fic family protein